MIGRRRSLAITIICLSGLGGFAAFRSHLRAQKQRKRDEAHELVVASVAREIKLGMQRVEVESLLRDRRISYSWRGGASNDDLIQLGEDPSPVWYCSAVRVSVAITFSPLVSHPLPSDTVTEVKLDRWMQDCM
jgi:hypothetical protein